MAESAKKEKFGQFSEEIIIWGKGRIRRLKSLKKKVKVTAYLHIHYKRVRVYVIL